MEHPTAGMIELVGPPFGLGNTSLGGSAPPPLLGQHTAEALAELGVDADRFAALERRGVVARTTPA